MHCYSQKVAEDRRYFTAKFNEFHASKFQAMQKTLKDWSLVKQLIFPLESYTKINCFPWNQFKATRRNLT